MKNATWIVLLLGLLTVNVRASDPGHRLEDLKWLLGVWVSATERHTATEEWTQVADTVFRGGGYTIDGDTKTLNETLLLLEVEGEVFYFAKVAHNPFPVPFKLTQFSEQTAAFENPEHDFPTKLVYQRTTQDSLEVAVSGPDGKGFTVRFQR